MMADGILEEHRLKRKPGAEAYEGLVLGLMECG